MAALKQAGVRGTVEAPDISQSDDDKIIAAGGGRSAKDLKHQDESAHTIGN
jgi:hypothetical protein